MFKVERVNLKYGFVGHTFAQIHTWEIERTGTLVSVQNKQNRQAGGFVLSLSLSVLSPNLSFSVHSSFLFSAHFRQ